MKFNIGGIDRILRIVIGLALIVWAVMSGNVWGWLGLIPLLTGMFKFCALYTVLGFSSCNDCKDCK